jgi:hypothetical protein
MPVVVQTIRKVPWTCRWGRFGGPVADTGEVGPGFRFWVCGHPEIGAPRLLGRDACAECRYWEALDEGRRCPD